MHILKKSWLLWAVFLLLLGGCAKAETAMPSNLTAVYLEEEAAIRVAWEAGGEASAYRVYRRAEADSNYKFLADVTGCTYLDEDLGAEGYQYRVTALAGSGESEPAESGTVYPTASESVETVVPAAPEITSVSVLDAYTSVILLEGLTDGAV